jgi:hypothetical protein
MLEKKPKNYDDGRTVQSFKDSADINKILDKAQRKGSLAHVQKYPQHVYGEFDGVDLLGALQRVERARTIFAELPSEVRAEFDQDAFKFVAFAADPANNARLAELLPAIAEPGRYFPNPVSRGATGAAQATPQVSPTETQDAGVQTEEAPTGAAEEAAATAAE